MERDYTIREFKGLNNRDDYEVYDEKLGRWVNFSESCYVRSGGFPYPEDAAHEITAVSIHSSTHDKYWVLGLGDDTWQSDECEYLAFDDEASLLESFVALWKEIDPDIITGWNIDVFDNLYIYNRITQVLGGPYAKSLSPWGIVNTRTFTNGFGKEATSIDFVGIASFDYIELYKKFTFKAQESYKLDHIAHVELGEKKISYEEHGDLMSLYEDDYHKFLDYSLKDTQLVKSLDDKMGLMDIGIAFSYMTKIPFDKVFGTIVPADAWIYNYCLEHGVIVPKNGHSSGDTTVVGGYVGNPRVGMIKWLLSADLTSLYPSIMRALNLSPETKLGKRDDVTIEDLLTQKIDTDAIEYTLAANGVRHSREKQGMIPFLVEGLFKERKMYKGKMLEAEAEKEAIKEEMMKRGISI
jgi:DNA polymerase elongation subunit (family B)